MDKGFWRQGEPHLKNDQTAEDNKRFRDLAWSTYNIELEKRKLNRESHIDFADWCRQKEIDLDDPLDAA